MPQYPKLVSTEDRIAKAAAEIEATQPSEAERTFLGLPLVQVNLPHSNPGKIPIWIRQNGDVILSIRPGWDHDAGKQMPYPYGTKPRLALCWMTTVAMRTKSRHIFLGDSMASFMRALGLNPGNGSGPRSDSRYLQAQLNNLFRATLSIDWSGNSRKSWNDIQVAPKGDLWWDVSSPDQTGFFESWVELSEPFFEAITLNPVPLDLRAVKAIKRSSFQLDLYAWATYKAWCAWDSGRPSFVTWRQLAGQLGADFGGKDHLKNFRKKLTKTHLPKVKGVFPTLDVEIITGGIRGGGKVQPGGLRINPCRPAIAPLVAVPGPREA